MKGLQFNSLSPNLLASGAGECDLCIWDVADPSKPSLYPALKSGSGVPGAAGSELTYLAWNKKVQVRDGFKVSAALQHAGHQACHMAVARDGLSICKPFLPVAALGVPSRNNPVLAFH